MTATEVEDNSTLSVEAALDVSVVETGAAKAASAQASKVRKAARILKGVDVADACAFVHPSCQSPSRLTM